MCHMEAAGGYNTNPSCVAADVPCLPFVNSGQCSDRGPGGLVAAAPESSAAAAVVGVTRGWVVAAAFVSAAAAALLL